MAGDQWESTKQLLQLVESESKWQHYPKGPVAFTQGEEARFSTQFIEHQMNLALEQGLALKALSHLRTYAPIFADVKDTEIDKFEGRINQAGEKQCQKLSADIRKDHFFYQEFTKKFCDFWSVQIAKKQIRMIQLPNYLYKALQLNFSVNSFPPDEISFLTDELAAAFKASPWFSVDSSKTLLMNITGDYKHDERKDQVHLSHSYEVKIPYTEVHTEKKREPPHDVLGQTLAVLGAFAVLGDTYSTSIDNKDGTETITEHKVRLEPRIYEYSATQYSQSFKLGFNTEATLEKARFSFNYQSEKQNKSIEHHNDLPSIGLFPAAAKLLSNHDFISESTIAMKTQFTLKAKDQWKEQFCRLTNSDYKLTDYSEAVLRCLYADLNPVPDFVDDWFLKNFGLKTAEARKRMQIGFVN